MVEKIYTHTLCYSNQEQAMQLQECVGQFDIEPVSHPSGDDRFPHAVTFKTDEKLNYQQKKVVIDQTTPGSALWNVTEEAKQLAEQLEARKRHNQ